MQGEWSTFLRSSPLARRLRFVGPGSPSSIGLPCPAKLIARSSGACNRLVAPALRGMTDHRRAAAAARWGVGPGRLWRGAMRRQPPRGLDGLARARRRRPVLAAHCLALARRRPQRGRAGAFSHPRLARRNQMTTPQHGGPIYSFGDYELDTRMHELRRAGERQHVEPQVFDVLAYLFASRDRLVTKEELLDGVWGHRYVAPTTLSSRIKHARQAVGDDGAAQSVIRTVHGLGFRVVATVEERGPDPAAGVRPLEQRIRFCTASDGVRIAYATSGEGPPLVKPANWLTHPEYDWESPVWRHWLRELSRDRTLVRCDEPPDRGTAAHDVCGDRRHRPRAARANADARAARDRRRRGALRRGAPPRGARARRPLRLARERQPHPARERGRLDALRRRGAPLPRQRERRRRRPGAPGGRAAAQGSTAITAAATIAADHTTFTLIHARRRIRRPTFSYTTTARTAVTLR